jgi:hypothetical protein
LLAIGEAAHAVVAFGFDRGVSGDAFSSEVFSEFVPALGEDGVLGVWVHGWEFEVQPAPFR